MSSYDYWKKREEAQRKKRQQRHEVLLSRNKEDLSKHDGSDK